MLQIFIQGKPNIGRSINPVVSKPTVAEVVETHDFIGSVVNQSVRSNDGFHNFAPHAPENVHRAWNKATQETGTNGLGLGTNGMATHIPAVLVMQVEQQQSGGSSDIFGNSVSTAMDAAKKILSRLENPLVAETNAKIRTFHEEEMTFYRSFIKNLEEYSTVPIMSTGYRL